MMKKMTLEELQIEIDDCLTIEDVTCSKRNKLEKEVYNYKKELLSKFCGKYIKINLDLATYGGYLYCYISNENSIEEIIYDDDLMINGIEVYEDGEMMLRIKEGNKVFLEDLIYAKEISKEEFMSRVDEYLVFHEKQTKQLKGKI